MQMQIQIDANPGDTAVSEVSMMRIIMMMMMMMMLMMMMMMIVMIDDHDDDDDESGGDDHYSEQGSWSCIIYCPSPSLLHNHDNINWTINDALMIKS